MESPEKQRLKHYNKISRAKQVDRWLINLPVKHTKEALMYRTILLNLSNINDKRFDHYCEKAIRFLIKCEGGGVN